MMQHLDQTMMQRALALAILGQGRVEPNPMVGAVICQGDVIVGEGWHQAFGGPHAEIHALQQAGSKSHGATLYVTLEPCCHHGKTPPCTDAVIAAGITRVVIASMDPFPEVAGKGIAALQRAGIEACTGILQAESELLNAPYFKLNQHGMPYVISKWAMTLDGRIATAAGDSRWISCEESRQLVHQLRGRVDAIIVGIGTVLADDPLLTARPAGHRKAERIILDRQLRIPLTSKVVTTARSEKTMIVHRSRDTGQIAELERGGCECLFIDDSSESGFIPELLQMLGKRKMTNVLVEGGGRVHGAFLNAKAVDEIWAFIAPKWIADHDAPGPVAGHGIQLMSDAGELIDPEIRNVGTDAFIRGRCRNKRIS